MIRYVLVCAVMGKIMGEKIIVQYFPVWVFFKIRNGNIVRILY